MTENGLWILWFGAILFVSIPLSFLMYAFSIFPLAYCCRCCCFCCIFFFKLTFERYQISQVPTQKYWINKNSTIRRWIYAIWLPEKERIDFFQPKQKLRRKENIFTWINNPIHNSIWHRTFSQLSQRTGLDWAILTFRQIANFTGTELVKLLKAQLNYLFSCICHGYKWYHLSSLLHIFHNFLREHMPFPFFL